MEITNAIYLALSLTLKQVLEANTVDPNEPSNQGLHCLLFGSRILTAIPFTTINVSNFEVGRVHYRNSGMKGLMNTTSILTNITGFGKDIREASLNIIYTFRREIMTLTMKFNVFEMQI